MICSLEYKLNSNQIATVLTFKGAICKDSLHVLDQCRGDIAPLGTKLFVIYFKDVDNVDLVACRHLTIIQQEIRKKGSLLVVGLSTDLKGFLLDKGIVRQNELKKTLEEALKVA